MEDCEWDYIVLRGCCAKWGLRPDDDVVPDLEAIANGNGDTATKVQQLGEQLGENARRKRQPA